MKIQAALIGLLFFVTGCVLFGPSPKREAFNRVGKVVNIVDEGMKQWASAAIESSTLNAQREKVTVRKMVYDDKYRETILTIDGWKRADGKEVLNHAVSSFEMEGGDFLKFLMKVGTEE